MDHEQLEFAIARYAEGDLPADEARALEAILDSEAGARELLAEERKLSAMLKGMPGTAVAWGELAADFSAVVTGTVDPAERAADQKLNSVIRAAGPMPAIRWDALARHISGSLDAELSGEAEDADLTRVLKSAAPLPAVKWDALASQISSHINASEAQAEERLSAMLQSTLAPEVDWDQLSRQIQAKLDQLEAHADERLDALLKSWPTPQVNWDVLATTISSNIELAEARADQELDTALKSTPMPAVNWDALATTISGRVAEAAGEQAAAESTQRERMRIGSGGRFVRNFTRMAIAAAVVVAAAVGIRMYQGGDRGGVQNPSQPVAVEIVEGPQREEATAAAVVDVQIGPSKSYAARTYEYEDYAALGGRAPVVFASPVRVAEDTAPSGFFE
ncbi:MAG: anti-sigma factor [Phycisphaerae bacterium]|nr:hypothetical protein [Tepidisphaeraceae bacterium]